MVEKLSLFIIRNDRNELDSGIMLRSNKVNVRLSLTFCPQKIGDVLLIVKVTISSKKFIYTCNTPGLKGLISALLFAISMPMLTHFLVSSGSMMASIHKRAAA